LSTQVILLLICEPHHTFSLFKSFHTLNHNDSNTNHDPPMPSQLLHKKIVNSCVKPSLPSFFKQATAVLECLDSVKKLEPFEILLVGHCSPIRHSSMPPEIPIAAILSPLINLVWTAQPLIWDQEDR